VPIVVVQDLGYESTQYSQFIGLVGFVSALLGLALGFVIDRKGIKFFYCLVLGLYGLLCFYLGQTDFTSVTTGFLITVGIIQALIYQGGFISFIASCMKLCWQKVSATQFAIYMAGANIGLSLGAGFYAAIESTMDTNQMFMTLGGVFFVGVASVWLTDFDKHRERVSALGDVEDFAPHA